jgi:hypothetical protein
MNIYWATKFIFINICFFAVIAAPPDIICDSLNTCFKFATFNDKSDSCVCVVDVGTGRPTDLYYFNDRIFVLTSDSAFEIDVRKDQNKVLSFVLYDPKQENASAVKYAKKLENCFVINASTLDIIITNNVCRGLTICTPISERVPLFPSRPFIYHLLTCPNGVDIKLTSQVDGKNLYAVFVVNMFKEVLYVANIHHRQSGCLYAACRYGTDVQLINHVTTYVAIWRCFAIQSNGKNAKVGPAVVINEDNLDSVVGNCFTIENGAIIPQRRTNILIDYLSSESSNKSKFSNCIDYLKNLLNQFVQFIKWAGGCFCLYNRKK